MSQLKSYLDSKNILLSIVAYSWPYQIVNHDLKSKQVSFWHNSARLNKIPFINLFEVFMFKDKSNSDPEKAIHNLYIKGNVP